MLEENGHGEPLHTNGASQATSQSQEDASQSQDATQPTAPAKTSTSGRPSHPGKGKSAPAQGKSKQPTVLTSWYLNKLGVSADGDILLGVAGKRETAEPNSRRPWRSTAIRERVDPRTVRGPHPALPFPSRHRRPNARSFARALVLSTC